MRSNKSGLSLLAAAQDDVAYAVWNDEFPSGLPAWARGAHAKGALALGASRGFWLTHSVSPATAAASTPAAALRRVLGGKAAAAAFPFILRA